MLALNFWRTISAQSSILDFLRVSKYASDPCFWSAAILLVSNLLLYNRAHFLHCWMFLHGFFLFGILSQTLTIHGRARGWRVIFSSLSLPPAPEHSDIYLQLSTLVTKALEIKDNVKAFFTFYFIR